MNPSEESSLQATSADQGRNLQGTESVVASVSLPDPHLRGRRLVSFDEARQTAARDLEEWDPGIAWGGLQIPSDVATTHFCAVGAPGSGKTMLLRLLMQSVLPLIGKSDKTIDVVRAIEPPPLPSLPLSSPPSRIILRPQEKLVDYSIPRWEFPGAAAVIFTFLSVACVCGYYVSTDEGFGLLLLLLAAISFFTLVVIVVGFVLESNKTEGQRFEEELASAQGSIKLCKSILEKGQPSGDPQSLAQWEDRWSHRLAQLERRFLILKAQKRGDEIFPCVEEIKPTPESQVRLEFLQQLEQVIKNKESNTQREIIKGPQWEGHRAIVYDAKQDIISLLYGMEGIECPIYTLNPFDKRCASWDMAKDITGPATAQQVATILIPKNENASQPFFNNAARHLLTGVFIALIKKAGKDWKFRDVLLATKSRKNLIEMLHDVPETCDLIERYLPPDESGRDVTANNILSALATELAPFEFVAAAWSHSQQEVSLRDWLDNEYILVLGNDEAHRASLDPINRVLFKRMTELILAGPETKTGRTWIFLDEARETGELDGLGRLMTKGRSKGACVVLGFQDIEGMREAYGEKLAHEIVGMCASKAILRLESPETAKWASEVFGEFEAFEDKKGWSQGSGETTGDATTTGQATTKGTATTQGSSNSKGWSSGHSSGGYSSNKNNSDSTNVSESENFSESTNSSRSTNSSQSKNWNESLNRERVQRAALLPSQFLTLPATNPRNGLTGYFVSPYIGAYQAWAAGEELAEQLHAPNQAVANIEHRDEAQQYLAAWTEADYLRLGLTRPQASPSAGAGDTAKKTEADSSPGTRRAAHLPDIPSARKPAKISEIDPTDFRAAFGIE